MRAGRTILHPTDLSFAPGDRIGLVGPSGSGKSTLCHALVDQLQARGVAVAHVPQSPDEALDPLRRLDFHWSQAERALGLAPDAARRAQLLRALDLEGRPLNVRPWGWSRGMQQRFVIALALLASPALLVLDEPTSALDPIVAATTLELVEAQAARTGTTLLIVTHDLGLAAARARRLLVLHEGKLVEDSDTGTLLTKPQSTAAQALVAHRNWADLPC
ncbi:peptide/nickel transport system ATP-binding protein/peptide/nickel transport system ATP-binding protein/nickel transport system ATP-binding protein [Pseudooceanicola antarcticus]|uniref:ABC transporter n=2 Tax=Pseudooceanicola antarcticus TaxID=1247613 RepID=A0A285JAK3_9RHOB|nr:ABC transporter [Pseudooceanicola antarcticus]SNY56416.1 peptide/nickel transport system ATP-binding protein/peptide/nickel transport system ATP-binding protein/nickel transport system ATP-binding protein [Pseudooceanicola antarcticus]